MPAYLEPIEKYKVMCSEHGLVQVEAGIQVSEDRMKSHNDHYHPTAHVHEWTAAYDDLVGSWWECACGETKD